MSKEHSHESYIGDDKKPEEALVAELLIITEGGGSWLRAAPPEPKYDQKWFKNGLLNQNWS